MADAFDDGKIIITVVVVVVNIINQASNAN